MMVRDIMSIAFRALRSNKLRSGLTMLGLVIGVAAVILLTSFGQGVGNSVNTAIAPIANSLTVVPKKSPIPGGPSSKPLTDADEQAIAKIPGVAQLVPQVTGATTGAAGQIAKAVTASVPSAHFTSASVTGTTANFLSANQKSVSAGRFFTPQEERSGAKVAILGPSVAAALYGSDPVVGLGRTLRLNHALFKVIGFMPSYGASGDNIIVMPMKAARSGVFGYGYGGDEITSIVVKCSSVLAVKDVEAQISQLMMSRHQIKESQYADFQVQDQGSRMKTFVNLIKLITGFVPAIAAISLLVGGIGVLNIMLVSVTDRTREIGTRKAIGASELAILTQFVMEAVALAGLGGLLGVAVGVSLIVTSKILIPMLGATGFLSTFDPVLSSPPIAVAFTISLCIGLLAGGYPAWRAAQLKPIEALRYE
jgi:putative ABC transport system permease protein